MRGTLRFGGGGVAKNELYPSLRGERVTSLHRPPYHCNFSILCIEGLFDLLGLLGLFGKQLKRNTYDYFRKINKIGGNLRA